MDTMTVTARPSLTVVLPNKWPALECQLIRVDRSQGSARWRIKLHLCC